MKKLLSIALCVVITMSVCNISILAFVPTDYDDPNCIDIRDLGTRKKFMTANNICRCKTCRFDALTYSYLEEYVKKLQIEAKLSDRANYIHKQKAITWESGKYGAINVVLLTDTVAAYFHSAIRGEAAYPVAKVIYYAIMVSGSLAAIVCQYKQTSYELIILENNIKLKNIESILRDISREIEYKSYKNMNFILASSNYDINGPMAVAQFAKKDDVVYEDTNIFNDEYFKKINEETIKPILNEIENGEFSTYEKREYETKIRDYMKAGVDITLPAALFAEAFNGIKLSNPEKIQKVKDYLKDKIDEKKVNSFFKEVAKLVENGFSLQNLLSLGAKTVTILTDGATSTHKKEL